MNVFSLVHVFHLVWFEQILSTLHNNQHNPAIRHALYNTCLEIGNPHPLEDTS